MTTTYAQHGEDTRLWSYFDGKKNGHYIDIGANDPVIDSVSKSFYDAGWRGINVEPLVGHATALRKAQPKSKTVQCAIGEDTRFGCFMYYDPERPGLTTLDAENAQRLGLPVRLETRTVTLANLCDAFAKWPIDWMKIDVEGWERQVIASGDWERFRPTIVVVEATVPMTDTPSHEEWEPLLLAADYELVDFDGLNRWYKDAR